MYRRRGSPEDGEPFSREWRKALSNASSRSRDRRALLAFPAGPRWAPSGMLPLVNLFDGSFGDRSPPPDPPPVGREGEAADVLLGPKSRLWLPPVNRSGKRLVLIQRRGIHITTILIGSPRQSMLSDQPRRRDAAPVGKNGPWSAPPRKAFHAEAELRAEKKRRAAG